MRLQEFFDKQGDFIPDSVDVIFPQFRCGPDHFVLLRDSRRVGSIFLPGHGEVDHVLVDAFLALCGRGIDQDIY